MQPVSMSNSSSARFGPFTTSIGVTLDVVAASAGQLNSGCMIASSAAIT